MRLLLDQGLPRSTVPLLGKNGIEALHVGEVGLASASDAKYSNSGFLNIGFWSPWTLISTPY